jgi:drug/metabolite transporter (DMT)-like permease
MKKGLLADSVLLLVAVIWGVTFVVVQEAIAELPPLAFNAVRFSIASLFLLSILTLFYRHQLKQINRKMLGAGFILGIWLFGGYAFQTIGLQYTTSSKAGFITGLSVVLVPVFAYIILKDLPKWLAIFGAVFATVGLYLLTIGDTVNMNIGDFYVFLCALCFGLQIVFTGKYAPHFPTLSLALIQISTVALLSGLSSPWIESGWKLAFDSSVLFHPAVFWALLVTAIPATALAFVAQTEFQKYTTPAHVALIFAMEPVFAAIADVWYVGTVLTAKAITGCLLILLGMILAELPTSALMRWLPWKKQAKVTNSA